MKITRGRRSGTSEREAASRAGKQWDSMGAGERAAWAKKENDMREYRSGGSRGSGAGVQQQQEGSAPPAQRWGSRSAPAGAPVKVDQQLQAAPKVDASNPFDVKAQLSLTPSGGGAEASVGGTPTSPKGGIKLAPPSGEGGAAPQLQGKGDVTTASNTQLGGGNFSIVKPRPVAARPSNVAKGTGGIYSAAQGTSALDRVAQRSVDRGYERGVTETNNGVQGGPQVTQRVERGPWDDPSLPTAVRQSMWNKRNSAPDRVVNTGYVDGPDKAPRSNRAAMEASGATFGADGRLANPAKDMASGMNYTRKDGVVLNYGRESGKQGFRLQSAVRPDNQKYTDDAMTTLGTTEKLAGGGSVTRYTDQRGVTTPGGTGANKGSKYTRADGSAYITDATGNVVGSARKASSPPPAGGKNVLITSAAGGPAKQVLADGTSGEVPRATPAFNRPESPATAPTIARASAPGQKYDTQSSRIVGNDSVGGTKLSPKFDTQSARVVGNDQSGKAAAPKRTQPTLVDDTSKRFSRTV